MAKLPELIADPVADIGIFWGTGAPDSAFLPHTGSLWGNSSNGDLYTLNGSNAWIQLGVAGAGSASWSSITGKPTTISGFGITDAFTQTAADARYWTQAQADGRYLKLTGGTLTGDLVGTRLTLHDNLIYESYTNGVANLALNYLGYAGGTSQYRDTTIYNGKSAAILTLTGSSKHAVFAGQVSAFDTIYNSVTSASATAFYTAVSGDATARWYVTGDGHINWGTGAAATDTNLYRAAAAALKTDGAFFVGGVLYAGACATARTVGDINARRSSTTGVYYFGDGANSYLYFDGGSYNFAANGGTADLNVQGSVNTANQVRAQGWFTGGGTGLAVEMGVSGGIGNIITYNRTTAAYGSMVFAASDFTFQDNGVGSLTVAVPARFQSYVSLLVGTTNYGYIKAAQSAGDLISGSATGNFCVRSESTNMLFSANGGSSAGMTLTSGHDLYLAGNMYVGSTLFQTKGGTVGAPYAVPTETISTDSPPSSSAGYPEAHRWVQVVAPL